MNQHVQFQANCPFSHVSPCAQVHVAVLRPGVCGAPVGGPPVRVAVKVQHEGLRELSGADIATVSAIVRLVKAFYPKVDYEWLADEVRVAYCPWYSSRPPPHPTPTHAHTHPFLSLPAPLPLRTDTAKSALRA